MGSKCSYVLAIVLKYFSNIISLVDILEAPNQNIVVSWYVLFKVLAVQMMLS